MLADYRKIDNTLYINADYHHEKVLELETKVLEFGTQILKSISGYHGGMDRFKWNQLEQSLRKIVNKYTDYDSGEWLEDEAERLVTNHEWVDHDINMLLNTLDYIKLHKSRCDK